MPENYTTLSPGTYIDLHTMACFTESADEISCIKYATNETFRISAQGFEMLSNAQRDAELTTQGGLYQAFSSIAELRFSDGNAMSCFFDAPGSQDFWCQTLSTPGWDDGNNLIHLTVTGGKLSLMGTQVGNPGLDYFRGRQLIEAPNSLLDASLSFKSATDSSVTPMHAQPGQILPAVGIMANLPQEGFSVVHGILADPRIWGPANHAQQQRCNQRSTPDPHQKYR